MIAIDLSKQQATDADPKARQQTILTGNIDQTAKKTTFFIVEEEKRIVLICEERWVGKHPLCQPVFLL